MALAVGVAAAVLFDVRVLVDTARFAPHRWPNTVSETQPDGMKPKSASDADWDRGEFSVTNGDVVLTPPMEVLDATTVRTSRLREVRGSCSAWPSIAMANTPPPANGSRSAWSYIKGEMPSTGFC
jgi:hypothetical protein